MTTEQLTVLYRIILDGDLNDALQMIDEELAKRERAAALSKAIDPPYPVEDDV